MKKQLRYILLVAIVAILTIVGYQSYWLTDIYQTLQANLQRDTYEAMRASDFDEIVRRVELLKDEHIGGRLQVKVGANVTRDSVEVNQNYDKNYTEKPVENEQEQPVEDTGGNQDNPLRYDEFANALRTEQDVINVGLHMQQGIHMGLDPLKTIDEQFYDSVLERRLDSLGFMGKHKLLHVRYAPTDSTRCNPQLLYESRSYNINKVDTFRFVIDPEGTEEYVLLQEKSIFILPHQMYSPILFSVFTLLILIVAFWYIIRMLKRMWALDEMKSDFTNNITHELKTPIAVAYAANDALLNHSSLDDAVKVRKYLGICQEQLNLLTNLVEQILSLSMERRQNMQLNIETLDVLPIVEKVVGNHQLKAIKPLEISVDIAPSVTVQADRMHFTNIINNLVDNAIKYSTDKAVISIRATQSPASPCTICVSDQGMGIPHDSLPFIFDKFYRVPHGNIHNVKGYGLGLFYVSCLMQRFGGEASVTSELGQGSTFRLIFPANK